MLLTSLTLRDFGTYKGDQSFNLRTASGKSIVLIGGKNGAGKSTFLEAIKLCLYGPLASKSTSSRDRYERYLLDRIHRDVSSSVPARSASVQVEFEFADVEGPCTYSVQREWSRNVNARIDETFVLKRDGLPVSDIDAAHWPDFIQELVPLGVSELFFFDGEKVQLLAEDDSDSRTLSDAVRNLLGLDIVERLSADLSIFRTRGQQKAATELQNAAELETLANTIELLRRKQRQVHDELLRVEEELIISRAELTTLEHTLQLQGGNYAKNRGRLEERRKQLDAKIQALESSIREYSAGLLPLALAPNLLRQVLNQLAIEQEVRFGAVVDESLAKAARNALSQLKKLTVRRGTREVLLGALPEFNEIHGLIQRTHKPIGFDAPLIHDLSGGTEDQIRSWAHSCLDVLPAELKRIGAELETTYRDLQKTERDISRAPSEDALQPLFEQLDAARKDLADKTAAVAALRSASDQAAEAVARAEINYKKATDGLAAEDSQRRALDKALQVQNVLAEFRSALLVKKIKLVEQELSACFDRLSRKKLGRTFTISPLTFQVTIQDRHGRLIKKSELSAGEKQLYAIAVLWALARVSGRPLPLIIDTPLARLDSEHRALLGRTYFPNASHQVIILSTDTEIDQVLLPVVFQSVVRSYELRFDKDMQATRVAEGYFDFSGVRDAAQ